MTAVKYEYRSGVAFLTLASPDAGNVLSLGAVEGVTQSVRDANMEEGCRAIVIGAAGSDFCKGMDFETLLSDTPTPIEKSCRALIDCLDAIGRSPKPVIAHVDGDASGGGVGLAAACDVVIASESARFTLSEAIIGMIPALIAPFLLRRIPVGRLRYMALSSRSLTAAEALTIGLVDEIGSPDSQQALDRQLSRILRSSPEALSAAKTYLGGFDEAAHAKQTEAAIATLASWLERPGALDGMRAFAKGFSPPWFRKYKGA